MSVTLSEIYAKPDTIPGETKKRKRVCDLTSEIYDSNGKTRRVNPYKLGERLGPDLVREMEVYIKPGAMMPSFAIRKELQERYQVDRRHLYDYFHSRGLRVAKEDRHSNLTRSRQAKAAAVAAVSASGKDSPADALSKKQAPKKVKGKLAQPALATSIINISSSPVRKVNERSKDDSSVSESSLYARDTCCSSPEPELDFTFNEISTSNSIEDDLELQYPAPPDDSQSSLSNVDDALTAEDPLPLVVASTSSNFPFNVNDWLAERTVADSSTCNYSPDTTLVDEISEPFSPLDFVKETLDSFTYSYDDFIKFDDDLVSSPTSAPEVPATAPIIRMKEEIERQQFYSLVADSLDSITKTIPTTQRVDSILCQQKPHESQREANVTTHTVGSVASSYAHLAEQNLCSASPSSSPGSVSFIVPAPPKYQSSPVSYSKQAEPSPCNYPYNPNHLQMGDRCAYSYTNESCLYRSDRFFVQLPSQEPIYQYRPYLPRPSRLRATSAGGGI